MKRIVNCKSGEIIDRELTDDEIKQQEIDSKIIEELKIEAEARQAAKQVILDRLGLTADELKTILA